MPDQMPDKHFSINQYVKVNKPGSPDHGRELQVAATRLPKKGETDWLYILWGSDRVFKESELQAAEDR